MFVHYEYRNERVMNASNMITSKLAHPSGVVKFPDMMRNKTAVTRIAGIATIAIICVMLGNVEYVGNTFVSVK